MSHTPSAGLARSTARPRPAGSAWAGIAYRFARNRLALVGLAIVLALLLMAIFAGQLAPTPYDVAVPAEARQFPSARHLLGTDEVGRDLLSRIIYGARISLTVGLSVQGVALLIGVTLGLLAGFVGGWVDVVVQRLVEALTAVPWMLFALVLTTILGGGLWQIILAIGLLTWVDLCRLVRAQILSLRESEFVLAARAVGVPEHRIALRQILPNTLSPVIITVALGIPTAIFAEAGLSFLGLGVNDPLPSWGKMVGNSVNYIRVYWHLGLFPTIMIALTMLGFSLLGDGLRDALDPRSAR